ncbi:MAG: adenylate kinase [Lachnospiraceae bacterium]|nr:adenylate kinase [Lachnospiraceae bacterium]MBQ6545558.1 adenylate kinase [Lachnospiraceae bacterium]
MRMIMLGAPGAGKGTQTERLAKHFGIPTISTGEIFRSNIKQGTELGVKVKAIIERGELVPDSLTCALVEDRISQPDCEKGYILDGFPRTIPQAVALDEMLAKRGHKLDYAANVDVPDEVIVERMAGRRICPSCGDSYHLIYHPPVKDGICDRCGAALAQRPDDAPETVLNRLSVYHRETQPLIDYYEKSGRVVTVDGTQPIDAVTANLVIALT